MLEIKTAAIKKIKELIEKQGKGLSLRIFMTEGCCGPSLAMDLISEPGKEDSEMEANNFKFYVHKDAVPQLENATIDCDKNGEILVKGLLGHGCGDDCGCGH
jgi:Fe-S cluster assembly iron-binding protein IscA